MLTREEWRKTAEYAAAAKYGEKYAGLLAFRRFLAGPVGVVILAGAAGLGAWWLWTHASIPSVHIPFGFVSVLGIALLLTIGAFRVKLFPPLTTARLFVAAMVWLGLIGYAVAFVA